MACESANKALDALYLRSQEMKELLLEWALERIFCLADAMINEYGDLLRIVLGEEEARVPGARLLDAADQGRRCWLPSMLRLRLPGGLSDPELRRPLIARQVEMWKAES